MYTVEYSIRGRVLTSVRMQAPSARSAIEHWIPGSARLDPDNNDYYAVAYGLGQGEIWICREGV